MAYWHRPLPSTGVNVAGPQVNSFWEMLHGRRTDMIVNGHAHRYAHFAPITQGGGTFGERHPPDRRRDRRPAGRRRDLLRRRPNVQRVKTGVSGVLRLGLRADSYAWKFVPVAGRSFTDRGTTSCH